MPLDPNDSSRQSTLSILRFQHCIFAPPEDAFLFEDSALHMPPLSFPWFCQVPSLVSLSATFLNNLYIELSFSP